MIDQKRAGEHEQKANERKTSHCHRDLRIIHVPEHRRHRPPLAAQKDERKAREQYVRAPLDGFRYEFRPPCLELLARHHAVLYRENGHQEQIDAERFGGRHDGSGVDGLRHDDTRDEPDGVEESHEEYEVGCNSVNAQRKPPNSMDAWDLVMRALSHYWRVTRQDNLVAQALLEKAIAIDPNYAQALGVLAASHTYSAHMGWTDMATAAPLAERAALAAILADSEDTWAHYALGCAYLYGRRFEDSLAEFELALRLNPNFSLARGYHGLALSYCGRWEEGIVAAHRALRLSPRDPYSAIYCGIAAYAHYVGRDYEEAMRLSREGIRQRSDFVGAHRVLTAAAGMAGQPEVGNAALQELRRVQPNISLAWIGSELPIRYPAELQHYLDGFRRSGLE